MPLFASKFSHRKTLPRKSPSLSSLHREVGTQRNLSELGLDYGSVTLKLGDVRSSFDNGQWTIDNEDCVPGAKEYNRLKKQNHHLKEENNLLKLKVEILLDMLAETTAETHIQAKEIEHLKSASSKKTQRK